MPEIAQRSAAHGDEIDAGVGVEVPIFGGKNGFSHVWRKRGEGTGASAGAVIGADVAKKVPVARKNAQRRHGGLAELGGKGGEDRHDHDEHERRRNRDEHRAHDAPPRGPKARAQS